MATEDELLDPALRHGNLQDTRLRQVRPRHSRPSAEPAKRVRGHEGDEQASHPRPQHRRMRHFRKEDPAGDQLPVFGALLRPLQGQRQPVPGAGVRSGRRHVHPSATRESLRRCLDSLLRRPDHLVARVPSPFGHRAPRPQAGEFDGRRRRFPQDRRLRPGQADRGARQDEHQVRHQGLHGAGAAGHATRLLLVRRGLVGAGCDDVRNDGRPDALRGLAPDGDALQDQPQADPISGLYEREYRQAGARAARAESQVPAGQHAAGESASVLPEDQLDAVVLQKGAAAVCAGCS